MVDPAIVSSVRRYLGAVRDAGIAVTRGILFGSCARGEGTPDSDVDLVVIAPEFDEAAGRVRAEVLWGLRATTDSRIEPFAVGERQWQEDDASVLIELARREGVEIRL
jgi:predicted nucleotidyltransferase